MASLIDLTMRFEALAERHKKNSPQVAKAMRELAGFIEPIYAGKLPDKRAFEQAVWDMDEAFEEPEALSEAFEAFCESCTEACQQQLRDSVSQDFIDHLREHWSSRTCPVCSRSDWSVPDCIFEVREYNGGKLVLGGDQRMMAIVPVVCQACGHTLMFSASHAKMTKPHAAWPRLPD